MRSGGKYARALLAWCVLAPCVAAAQPVQPASHGRFQQVPVQQPQGPVQRVVLWFHAPGKAAAAQREREALRASGALVVPVDMGQLQDALKREGSAACAFGAGDVENFSRWLQAWLHLPGYRLPLLAGDGDGARFAYVLAAQAGEGVFAGVLTTGFQPGAVSQRMACGAGIVDGVLEPAALTVPWLAADSGAHARAFQQTIASARSFRRTAGGDALPGLLAAARVLGEAPGVNVAPAPKDLGGLPVVEVPSSVAGDTVAIFVSGDGGWAGLDKDVAAALAAQGVSVVGVDSLRYFWSARTPAGFAADLTRIADYYRQRWQRPKLLLIGFSQGADVLPASINQLAPALRSQVELIALLSVGRTADFEFHVSNWLGSNDDGLPIAPEIARLPTDRTLCVYGQKDADALCPELPPGVRVLQLPGDHHFNGDHDRLAREILNAAAR
ncbi:AcvB/VirJ family lysyl-phosphatidylglycerol hydrolase [Stenotrophomonas sp. SORGH_AS_0321]|uniref:virulence factor family protein n=1 Tax=Stenotrophomonas sp. SORGH_AS_0321 TaxID=3041787 RepID=UPI0028601E95|nr:AcvB/VirJ family lysyl-phosphatidylglycerol hydrolase [Stenotrophomonas sp. SORGH_AS_0321]MDR6093835.1 type IV secretory pathway VirJ component [Stenotrophomonas sp. SORGH_AS_0321]